MKGGVRSALTEAELLLGLRLVGGKGTPEQIGKAIVRGRKVCLAMLRKLEERGVVHICGWLPTPGEVPAIYALGKGRPAPKPTRTESYQMWAEQHPEEFRKQQARRSQAMKRANKIREQVKTANALSTDQRPALERWACPDLSALPRSIYFVQGGVQ